MGREGSEKALHWCEAAKWGCQTGCRLGNQPGEEAAACPAASTAGAGNSIYIKRELILSVVLCLFRLCSEHSAAMGVWVHLEIFDI